MKYWLESLTCGIKGFRVKSLMVENGETLINCLAYMDFNPLRAGLVERPEEYRLNSLGYHVQTDNPGNFLSTDFDLKEFNFRVELRVMCVSAFWPC